MKEQKFVEARQKDRRSDIGEAFNKVEEALKETENCHINVRKNDQRGLKSSVNLEAGKERKKKHRENTTKDRISTTLSKIDDLESERTEKTKGQKIHDKEEIPKVNTGEEVDLKKNKDDDDYSTGKMTNGKEIVMNDGEERYQKREKKLKRDKGGGHIMNRNSITNREGKEPLDGIIVEKTESSTKERMKKQKRRK